jgi:hypothetical protein
MGTKDAPSQGRRACARADLIGMHGSPGPSRVIWRKSFIFIFIFVRQEFILEMNRSSRSRWLIIGRPLRWGVPCHPNLNLTKPKAVDQRGAFRSACAHKTEPNKTGYAAWSECHVRSDKGQCAVYVRTPSELGVVLRAHSLLDLHVITV